MYTISSEQIIGSYAVRYKTLIPIINKEYAGSNANAIDIFIDVADMIKTIARQPVSSPNPYSIASSIINLCAHYRNFFSQYYKTETRIYLITSIMDEHNGPENSSINRKFLPDYAKRTFGDNQSVNGVISSSFKLLQLLVPYIEDIDFCIIPYEFGVYVYDIISYNMKNGTANPGIVLTKDIYNYQLVSDDMNMIKILRPKKDGNEDISCMISYKDAIYRYCEKRKVEYINNRIDSSLLSFIMAMTRLPERNLKSLHQVPATIKALKALVDSGTIMNQRTVDIQYLCKQIGDVSGLKVRDPYLVEQRFKAIDIEIQVLAYNAESFTKFDGIKNLFDPNAVKEISMQYFKDYPLDLNVL